MAYSLYEKPQLKTAKNVQYYPEEYDYSDYYNAVHMKNIDTLVPSTRKYKKSLPSIDYENERKCPIYIHQFNKSTNLSMYNNYSPRNYDNILIGKQLPPKRNRPQKLTLDKLEETYWATWKPNKEAKGTKHAKVRNEREVKAENKRRVGASDHIIKYFAASDFPTSSGSVLGREEKLEISTNTQEIQTDYLPPVILSEPSEGTISISEQLNKSDTSDGNNEIYPQEARSEDSKESQETIIGSNDTTSSKTLVEEDKAEEEENTKVKNPRKKIKKLLKHTDSFIIHKKKQDEIKCDVQQPRCIKLYKKTASTFLKGGSYPLKSCMTKVSSEKGNFRLGAPGSPLFVTSSSFNKKYSR